MPPSALKIGSKNAGPPGSAGRRGRFDVALTLFSGEPYNLGKYLLPSGRHPCSFGPISEVLSAVRQPVGDQIPSRSRPPGLPDLFVRPLRRSKGRRGSSYRPRRADSAESPSDRSGKGPLEFSLWLRRSWRVNGERGCPRGKRGNRLRGRAMRSGWGLFNRIQAGHIYRLRRRADRRRIDSERRGRRYQAFRNRRSPSPCLRARQPDSPRLANLAVVNDPNDLVMPFRSEAVVKREVGRVERGDA